MEVQWQAQEKSKTLNAIGEVPNPQSGIPAHRSKIKKKVSSDDFELHSLPAL